MAEWSSEEDTSYKRTNRLDKIEKLTKASDYITSYTNTFTLVSTGKEINISFGSIEYDPSIFPEERKLQNTYFTTVTMSPETAELLVILLQLEIKSSREHHAKDIVTLGLLVKE